MLSISALKVVVASFICYFYILYSFYVFLLSFSYQITVWVFSPGWTQTDTTWNVDLYENNTKLIWHNYNENTDDKVVHGCLFF